MIHLSSTEGIQLARVCNQERNTTIPRGCPGSGAKLSLLRPGDPVPGLCGLHPIPVRSCAAPAPFPTARSSLPPPMQGPESSGHHGILRVREGWRRGERTGVSAHWLCAAPRDSAVLIMTGKSKAFYHQAAEKTLFPGPIRFTLRNLTMCPLLPLGYFSALPRIGRLQLPRSLMKSELFFFYF